MFSGHFHPGCAGLCCAHHAPQSHPASGEKHLQLGIFVWLALLFWATGRQFCCGAQWILSTRDRAHPLRWMRPNIWRSVGCTGLSTTRCTWVYYFSPAGMPSGSGLPCWLDTWHSCGSFSIYLCYSTKGRTCARLSMSNTGNTVKPFPAGFRDFGADDGFQSQPLSVGEKYEQSRSGRYLYFDRQLTGNQRRGDLHHPVLSQGCRKPGFSR